MDKTIQDLEKKIGEGLGMSPDSLVFSYKKVDGVIHLDVITYNPRHNQSFLFYSVKAIDKKEALTKVLEYIDKHISKEESYTIQWVKIGENDLHTSYFRAKNIYDVLDKFYFERDINSYRIFNISLNPIS